MRNAAIAGVLLFSMFTLTGCESKQAKATRLEKVANGRAPDRTIGADAVLEAPPEQ